MLREKGEPPHGQAAEENAAEDGEEIADVHGHYGEHAG